MNSLPQSAVDNDCDILYPVLLLHPLLTVPSFNRCQLIFLSFTITSITHWASSEPYYFLRSHISIITRSWNNVILLYYTKNCDEHI